MSATKSASTGMPYLKPKLTTRHLAAGSSPGVPNASAIRSVSWCTLSAEVSMTRSASLRRSASTSRSRWSPSSSRPLALQRVRAAGRLLPADEDLVGRLEEDQGRVPAGGALGEVGLRARRRTSRSGRRPRPRSAARGRGSRRPAGPRRAAGSAAGCRRRRSRGPRAPWPRCCGRRRSSRSPRPARPGRPSASSARHPRSRRSRC